MKTHQPPLTEFETNKAQIKTFENPSKSGENPPTFVIGPRLFLKKNQKVLDLVRNMEGTSVPTNPVEPSSVPRDYMERPGVPREFSAELSSVPRDYMERSGVLRDSKGRSSVDSIRRLSVPINPMERSSIPMERSGAIRDSMKRESAQIDFKERSSVPIDYMERFSVTDNMTERPRVPRDAPVPSLEEVPETTVNLGDQAFSDSSADEEIGNIIG